MARTLNDQDLNELASIRNGDSVQGMALTLSTTEAQLNDVISIQFNTRSGAVSQLFINEMLVSTLEVGSDTYEYLAEQEGLINVRLESGSYVQYAQAIIRGMRPVIHCFNNEFVATAGEQCDVFWQVKHAEQIRVIFPELGVEQVLPSDAASMSVICNQVGTFTVQLIAENTSNSVTEVAELVVTAKPLEGSCSITRQPSNYGDVFELIWCFPNATQITIKSEYYYALPAQSSITSGYTQHMFTKPDEFHITVTDDYGQVYTSTLKV
ncbi:MAG: hypothetical protein CMK63_04785 [Pseudoalteromonadaceae bacterium]|nr:hypothetical protein [Pseudoalteromonadaceae bacterium]|tara:strand:- start:259 stop:1059 length:801 start_codon:yes stop_codon:yes gene_type:complete